MLEISKLSSRYSVRMMTDSDAEAILDLCKQNSQYYQYCGKQPSIELILNDLRMTPPGIGLRDKYYVGFYNGDVLTAVMDLIDGYPEGEYAYIGFFMMNRRMQGRQLGSEIIQDVCRYLREAGFSAVRLAIDKGNPQSTHFWKKNGFQVMREAERDGGTLLVADKELRYDTNHQ